MQVRVTSFLPVAVFVASAIASGSSQCDTGSIQCCTGTYSPTDSTLTELLGTLNVVLPDSSASGLVGLGCSSITGVGTGSGASCTQQPVCCTDNQYNGLINIGCSPITISL